MNALRHTASALRFTVLLACASMLLAAPALAQTATAQDETKVKAAFLLRFAQFVAWPQDALPPGEPFTIGVAGSDAIAAELTQQAPAVRSALGRPVTVRNVKAGEEARGLHLLFVGADEQARIDKHAAAVRGRRVLVVTESPGALEQGSMINFVIDDRRVKFEIKLEAAEKAGLTLSSRLLAVALRVLKGELDNPLEPAAIDRLAARGSR